MLLPWWFLKTSTKAVMWKGGANARAKRTDALQCRRRVRARKARKREIARKRPLEKTLETTTLTSCVDGKTMETTTLIPCVDTRPAKMPLSARSMWECACGLEYPDQYDFWTYWESQKHHHLMWHCKFCNEAWMQGISPRYVSSLS